MPHKKHKTHQCICFIQSCGCYLWPEIELNEYSLTNLPPLFVTVEIFRKHFILFCTVVTRDVHRISYRYTPNFRKPFHFVHLLIWLLRFPAVVPQRAQSSKAKFNNHLDISISHQNSSIAIDVVVCAFAIVIDKYTYRPGACVCVCIYSTYILLFYCPIGSIDRILWMQDTRYNFNYDLDDDVILLVLRQ